MLSKEQLQDASECMTRGLSCEYCSLKNVQNKIDCTENVAKAALELMEENDILRKELDNSQISESALYNANQYLRNEIERLKIMLNICEPYRITLSGVMLGCKFCGGVAIHTDDCEYAKAVENV